MAPLKDEYIFGLVKISGLLRKLGLGTIFFGTGSAGVACDESVHWGGPTTCKAVLQIVHTLLTQYGASVSYQSRCLFSKLIVKGGCYLSLLEVLWVDFLLRTNLGRAPSSLHQYGCLRRIAFTLGRRPLETEDWVFSSNTRPRRARC